MFKQLEIQDFQSHEATRIEFSPRLTALLGPSNSGKTAILRAIGWILRNRPRGSGFVRNGADAACVSLTTDAGVVSRSRDRKGRANQYVVNGETLTALGADVPEQVTALLGLADINLSDQLAPHYLLLDPPGKIASTLNDAANLGRAERLVDGLAAEARDAKVAGKAARTALDGARAALGGLSWTDLARTRLDSVVALESVYNARVGPAADLAVLARQFAQAEVALAAALPVPEGVDEVLADMEDLAAEQRGLARDFADLVQLADRLASLPAAADLGPATERLAAVESDFAVWYTAAGELNDLMDIEEPLVKNGSLLDRAGAAVRAMIELEAEAVTRLDTCPSCGQALGPEAKNVLIERIGA